MSEELNQIKSRSFVSALSVVGQSGYSAALGFAAFFILTLRSGAHLLGVYGTVLATLSAFNYFTNLGLGAAIMQKKEVRQIDLNTSFYIQLALTTIAVIVGFVLTPQVFTFYRDLPSTAINLYWAVLISFFLLSLKSIPSVLLEKEIQIYKVVLVQAMENTLFYVTIIIMVFLGFEIESLIVAVLLRSIFGFLLIYVMKPWIPTFTFSRASAKELLRYGIPFQGNSFLAIIKDDLLIIYLGGAIGLSNLGVVMFAKKYAEFSIRLVMDSINRVAFPLFARFQKNRELLVKSLEKVLFYESVLIFPIIIGGIFVFDSVLKLVPGYFGKWQLALPSFYFFSISSLFISLSTPFINLFNAVGKVTISLFFMIFWTALLWFLILLLLPVFGIIGISVAFVGLSFTFFLVYMVARSYVQFSLWGAVKENLIATIVMAGVLVTVRYVGLELMQSPLIHVVFSVLVGSLVYFYTVNILKKKRFIADLVELFKLRYA